MEIKTFIEKAIEGGWQEGNGYDKNRVQMELADGFRVYCQDSSEFGAFITAEMLLDPLAWQAVGNVERWAEKIRGCGCCGKEEKYCRCCDFEVYEGWKHKMLSMTRYLVEGKTIEEFLKTL